jgi:hypothetical protein
MPRGQYHPTPEERDEQAKAHPPAEEAIAAIMETGPHPEEEWEDSPGEPHAEPHPEDDEERSEEE